MWVLIAIGLLAGLITGVSPCVLPVLPVVSFAGGTAHDSPRQGARLRRAGIIILGLVADFSVYTLLGSALLTAIDLPAEFLRWAGLVVLVLVGLGLLFPPLQRVLERPFQQLPKAFTRGNVSADRPGRFGGNAFVLGLGVGTLYVPCAGPVLAAISIAGISGHLSGGIIALTVAFAVGVGIPLFILALAGGGSHGVDVVADPGSRRDAARVALAAVPATEKLLAPGHFAFEVISGLGAATHRPNHPLRPADLDTALQAAAALEIVIEGTPWSDVDRAWTLAQGSLRYADAIYVAAAERHGTALLTADSQIDRCGALIRCEIITIEPAAER